MLIVVSVIRGCRTSGVAGTEVSCTLMIFYVVGHIYSAEVISSGWVIIMLLTFVGSCLAHCIAAVLEPVYMDLGSWCFGWMISCM